MEHCCDHQQLCIFFSVKRKETMNKCGWFPAPITQQRDRTATQAAGPGQQPPATLMGLRHMPPHCLASTTGLCATPAASATSAKGGREAGRVSAGPGSSASTVPGLRAQALPGVSSAQGKHKRGPAGAPKGSEWFSRTCAGRSWHDSDATLEELYPEAWGTGIKKHRGCKVTFSLGGDLSCHPPPRASGRAGDIN